jgi:hypothetical protein
MPCRYLCLCYSCRCSTLWDSVVNKYGRAHMQARTHIHPCKRAHTHTHTHTHARAHARTQTHTHARTHTHTHVRTCAQREADCHVLITEGPASSTVQAMYRDKCDSYNQGYASSSPVVIPMTAGCCACISCSHIHLGEGPKSA